MSVHIVFFGSPQFAVPSLEALANDARLSVELVVTQPDRRAGRGRGLIAPPVKLAAETLGINVWQPTTLRSIEAQEQLRSIESDLFVVVAYGELFPRAVLSIPRHGSLNVHPSLLPRYRGSAPIQTAILNGDAETGVSIIQMVRRLDAGPIVAQQRYPLGGTETGASLSDALALLAARMLPDVLVDWTAGRVEPRQQDDDEATYTRELTKTAGEIDWNHDAVAIERQVRAYQPWPTAWTTLNARRIVIDRCAVEPSALELPPGTLERVQRDVFVAAGSGSLKLITVRPEGKSEMPADAWFRGLRSAEQPRFSPPSASRDAGR